MSCRYFFLWWKDPTSGLRPLFFDISTLQLDTCTHPVGLLYTSDQLVAEPTTFTTNTKDEHLFPQRYPNPRSPHPNARRPTPWSARLPRLAVVTMKINA